LPYRLHARDPIWVPPLRRDVALLLDRRKNPFFEHAEAEYFLAERDGRVAGRIAAIANHLHNETHRDRVGFFGFFESEHEPAVAGALLDAAADWLRARHFDRMRGPASFSVNDECGLLVEGYDTPPALMMPHNPPYYEALVEGAGCVAVKNLLVYENGDAENPPPVPERLARATDLLTRRLGLTVRSLRMGEFREEVERVKQLYNAAWERNWGFVPMTDREIDHLADQFKAVVIPDLVPFIEKDGHLVGFGLALPDLNQALRANRNGRFLPALVRILWALKTRRINRCRIMLLGIDPAYRGKGLDAVLYEWIWSKGTGMGIGWGEAGWILEDNAVMNAGLRKMGFRVYKTYRLYERSL
jgi:GNAT superfamily N-acetyltransferase